jgi:hypothetical protein
VNHVLRIQSRPDYFSGLLEPDFVSRAHAGPCSAAAILDPVVEGVEGDPSVHHDASGDDLAVMRVDDEGTANVSAVSAGELDPPLHRRCRRGGGRHSIKAGPRK